MRPGLPVRALKNHNRVEEGTIGEVIEPPKGSTPFSRPDDWIWVQFNKVYGPKLMKPSELEIINHDPFYG